MTDEVNEMYVLAATRETQGLRDDDYVWTVDGELVFVPTFECRDRSCGCNRGFAGVTSRRATTTAVIVDRPELEPDAYWGALFDAMCEQGYVEVGDEDDAEVVDGLIQMVQILGSLAGDGTVVGRCGSGLTVRRPGSPAARDATWSFSQ